MTSCNHKCELQLVLYAEFYALRLLFRNTFPSYQLNLDMDKDLYVSHCAHAEVFCYKWNFYHMSCRDPPVCLNFKNSSRLEVHSMDADKKRIWMDGQLIEVTEAVYEAYMKGDRKIRYFERDLKTERFVIDKDGRVRQIVPSREDSLDRLSEDNAEQFPDERESVEELVLRKLRHEQLRKALDILTEKERALILALFFEEKTEREVADAMGISQPAVHKQKNKILKKFLKKTLELRDFDYLRQCLLFNYIYKNSNYFNKLKLRQAAIITFDICTV